MLIWIVTQALAGAIDRGDPMGVQEVLGEPGMERGYTRSQRRSKSADKEWRETKIVARVADR